MKRILYAYTAAAALCAAPAAARDGSAYVGIEAGITTAKDFDADRIVFTDVTGGTFTEITFAADDIAEVELGRGYDADLIAGYDFGLFRLEAELARKSVNAEDFDLRDDFAADIEQEFTLGDDDFDWNGGARVTSLMANGLVDFGGDRFGGYVGAGVGRARVKLFGDRDSAMAYQLIAGVRAAVTDSIDLGLKYRFFRTGRVDFLADDQDTGGRFSTDAEGRFRSHSLLASLVFNFGRAGEALPPPPPPAPTSAPAAPPPPATQTCADGSVILATESCPPPPPPPPPPAGERG